MVRIGRGNNDFAFQIWSKFGVTLDLKITLIVIFALMCSSSTTGWKLGVRDQDKTCYLYSHETKTCFIQSHVNGRVVLPLSLMPTAEADSATPPHVSWSRRVKLRNKLSLVVRNLLEGGRPPEFMELSANHTDLTIKILSEYDMNRNSFKARVGGKEHGDHQNFVVQSEPIDFKAPKVGEFVAFNTMDYFTIPGRDAHFDWSKKGARHLPRNAGISHDGKRLVIRHYLPAEDSGVYVCEVYSPEDYFIAGRHFILGSALHTTTGLSANVAPYDQGDNAALLERKTSQADVSWLQNVQELNVAPLDILEIVHTFKNNGEIYYILHGRTQYLACLPSNMAAVDLASMHLRYGWDRPKSSDVIGIFDTGRYLTVDGGILEIANVEPRDSGILECNVTYNDVTGQPTMKSYTYGIQVYTLPDFVYTVSVAYTTNDCGSPQRSGIFKQLLGTHLQSSVVADDTSLEITDFMASCNNSVRIPTVKAGAGPVQGGRLNLLSFDLVVRHTMVTHCSMQCMVGEMDTKTKMIGTKLADFFSGELEKEQIGYHPSRLVPHSLQFRLKYRCERGYGLHASICLACPPGTHSHSSSSECAQCPIGSYESSFGAVDCVQCPAHEYTFWYGAVFVEQCQVKTVIMWSMLGVFGMMTLSGLIVSCILYRHRKRLQMVHSKKHFSSPDSSSIFAHQSELEELLESSDDENTTSVSDESLQSCDASGSEEESDVYQYMSQEPRQDLQAEDRTEYEHWEEDISQYNSVHKGDIDVADRRTNQDIINSYLPDNEVLEKQRDPLDQLSRSQMVNELGPNGQNRLSRPSLHYSNTSDLHRKSVLSQANTPLKVYSRMVSYESPPQDQSTFSSHQAFIPETQGAHLTPKHSSQIRDLTSPLHHQASSSLHRKIPIQEDNFQPKSFHDHIDTSLSPSYTQRRTPVASPSQISSASSTFLPEQRESPLSSVGPSSPVSSRPGSPVVPGDISDATDSEIEIGSFIIEGDNLQTRKKTRRSSVFSKPQVSPRRSSVAALIASYQSLSRSGPTATSPRSSRILDRSSFESTITHSTKTSAVSIKGQSATNTMVPLESSPQFSETFSKEPSLLITFSNRASSDFLEGKSPPTSPRRDLSRTFNPPISPVMGVTPVISHPGSYRALTGSLQLMPSRTATLTQEELNIPPFSPPRTPQEVRSMSPPISPRRDHSRTFNPPISPIMGVTPVISHPGSSRALTGSLQQMPSRTATLTQEELDIPPFSPPSTPQEVRSMSPPISPRRDFSKTFNPPISPVMAVTSVISHPGSYGAFTRSPQQMPSRTATLTQEGLGIPQFSPPRTPQEVRSMSPPISPRRDFSKTFNPPISPVMGVTSVISHPESYGAFTRSPQQMPSRTATLTQEGLGIPQFSPPKTPLEVRSRILTPCPSAVSKRSSHTPLIASPPSSPPLVQPSMTRRSSLMTSPAGRPSNPFQQQRLRRQSLAEQISSHLSTATLLSTPHLDTASADGGYRHPAQDGALIAPPSFSHIPISPTVASSLHIATPYAVSSGIAPPVITTHIATASSLTIVPPPVETYPSTRALPEASSTFAPPLSPMGSFSLASTAPPFTSAHSSLVTSPSGSISKTAPVGEPLPLLSGAPPPSPPHSTDDELPPHGGTIPAPPPPPPLPSLPED